LTIPPLAGVAGAAFPVVPAGLASADPVAPAVLDLTACATIGADSAGGAPDPTEETSVGAGRINGTTMNWSRSGTALSAAGS
jgi:hypothetical protein